MKKNNKGFSLVELIVVVLIMGIIAVALAPQVMKWVGKARTNSDSNTMKDIKSAIQVAIADAQTEPGYTVTALSETVYDASGIAGIPNTTLRAKIQEVTGEDYSATKADGSAFKFTINSSGVVTVY